METYSQDVFVESITHKKSSPLIRAASVLCMVLAVLMFVVGLFNMPAMILFAIFTALAYFISLRRTVEYEASFTNGLLDLDAIYGGRSRKNIISMDMENLVVMARENSAPLAAYTGRQLKTYDASGHNADSNIYCIIFKNPGHGNKEEKILFEPNEQMLDAIWRKYPSKVHNKV